MVHFQVLHLQSWNHAHNQAHPLALILAQTQVQIQVQTQAQTLAQALPWHPGDWLEEPVGLAGQRNQAA